MAALPSKEIFSPLEDTVREEVVDNTNFVLCPVIQLDFTYAHYSSF